MLRHPPVADLRSYDFHAAAVVRFRFSARHSSCLRYLGADVDVADAILSLLLCDRRFEDDCLVEPFFCEKDHRLVRVEVDLNENSGAVTCGAQEILINDWCTGSNHHGGGGMDFLPNGDMIMAVGDMSKVSHGKVDEVRASKLYWTLDTWSWRGCRIVVATKHLFLWVDVVYSPY